MERAISVRLDVEAERALQQLTSNGRSRSGAIREALVALAALRLRVDLAGEAQRLSADVNDRAEKRAVTELMESLRAAR